MNPKLVKSLHIALLVLGAVAALGPVFQPLSSVLPAAVSKDVYAAISFAGLLIAYSQKPVLAAWLKSAGVPPVSSIVMLVAAGSLAIGCSWFGPAATAASADIAPVLACIVAAANADSTPSATAIETAAVNCGVAAADVASTVQAIEALANTPALAPTSAAKVKGMKHAAVTTAMRDWDNRFFEVVQ